MIESKSSACEASQWRPRRKKKLQQTHRNPSASVVSSVQRAAAMPWTEILTLTIGVALIVTMICSQHA
jgi:hypothetical protein